MNNTQIQVKYFDIKGNVIKDAKSAVKAEVWHLENGKLNKIEYFHVKKRNNQSISTN